MSEWMRKFQQAFRKELSSVDWMDATVTASIWIVICTAFAAIITGGAMLLFWSYGAWAWKVFRVLFVVFICVLLVSELNEKGGDA